MNVFRMASVVLAAAAIVGVLTSLQWWYGAPNPHSLLDWSAQVLMAFWLPPIVPALFTLVGLVFYRQQPLTSAVAPLSNVVCFRVVTRGTNPEVVSETVANIRRQMRAFPLFPYYIEVVTDTRMGLEDRETVEIVVPRDYRTPNGSLYKARALDYALSASGLPDEGWLVHLDEETQLTPSAILGIRRAVEEEERSGRYRIGQGAILYNRMFKSRLLLSLADMVRTGDDMGRFFLQHKIGFTLFGLHGSWILVRNSVEKEVGFDFGPKGSITEDAFWALCHMARGRRCRWVNGYMIEQPPVSVLDFLRQRRRWFWGLVLVTRYAPVALRYRVSLGLCTLLWGVSWIGVAATYLDFFVHQSAPFVVRFGGNVTVAVFLLLYLVGLHENLRELRVRRLTLYPLQVALLPAFTLLEATALVYALIQPERGFHVVKKPATSRVSRQMGPIRP